MKYVGRLDVEMGGMFSGKSEELIRKCRRAEIAGNKVQVFKPKLDDRYSDTEVVTHYGRSINCEVVTNSQELYRRVQPDTSVVAIDEVQFFDDRIYDIIMHLKRDKGIDVIVAGLDMWASGEPVMIVAKLAAVSNDVQKFHAVCQDTGEDAYISYCTVEKDGDVLVGGTDKYIALSEKAYLKRMNK